MKVGDLVRYNQRTALILDIAGPLAKTTLGWINMTILEVISAASR